MSVEAGPVYPIWEEIEKKRDVAFNLRKRIANGEGSAELLKQYFRAERDFRQWAYRTPDPHNSYYGQKNMAREAKEFDDLLNGDPRIWSDYCEKWSNGLKKWIQKHNVQGEEKDRRIAQANNWSKLAAKLRKEQID